MRTTDSDVLYCNVDVDKIKNANPKFNEVNFRHLHDYITERAMIRRRKDVLKLQPPWTDNEAIRRHRYTNIKRETDLQSRWLIKNISTNPNMSISNKILNTALFRMYSKYETFRLITPTFLDFDIFNLTDMEDIRQRMLAKVAEDKNYAFFTNAFLSSGLKVGTKDWDEFTPMRIVKLTHHMAETGLPNKIMRCKSQLEVIKALEEYKGIGKFMSYQIFVDLTYIPEFPFSENEFTMSGPGCDSGLRLLFEDFDGLGMEEAIFWLRDNLETEFAKRKLDWYPEVLFADLPVYDQNMNVMSLENCMCELFKYIKVLTDTGRPRSRYYERRD